MIHFVGSSVSKSFVQQHVPLCDLRHWPACCGNVLQVCLDGGNVAQQDRQPQWVALGVQVVRTTQDALHPLPVGRPALCLAGDLPANELSRLALRLHQRALGIDHQKLPLGMSRDLLSREPQVGQLRKRAPTCGFWAVNDRRQLPGLFHDGTSGVPNL